MVKPAPDTRICLFEGQCIDIDGDGYGVGVDCLGFDYNDNDPAVHEPPTQPIETPVIIRMFRINIYYLLVGLASIFILVFLIVFLIKIIKKPTPTAVVISKDYVAEQRKQGKKFSEIERQLREMNIEERAIKSSIISVFIKEAKDKGYDKDKIREILKNYGCSEEEINEYISS